MNDQSIVACATPRGEGAVSIVRISGTDAFAIADRCFHSLGSTPFSSLEERRMVYGVFRDPVHDNRLIDRCLAVRFAAPRSFSGEDIVEFHLHGNPLIVEQVLRVCCDLGCRPAAPGEFSRRALLNGRMDLSQAEALGDVIRAESELALDLAQRQLGGALSAKFNEFRQKLVGFLALLELELDFVQEGYALLDYHDLQSTLEALAADCEALMRTYRTGDRLRRGPRVLLLGRPNAGKSSLFNALIGFNRALVSNLPGTTRDYLEERIHHNGVILHLIDTAGLRTTEDFLEAEGVSRARDLLPLADHILYLIDSTLGVEERERELASLSTLSAQFPTGTFYPVYTKSDLGSPPEGSLFCSVLQPDSVAALLDRLLESYSSAVSDQLMLLSERQVHRLREIQAILSEITLDSDLPTEFLSSDLRRLLAPLSELSGDVTNEDILDAVFSGFCIGK